MICMDPRTRGYSLLYHEGESMHCPGCGRRNWIVGRSMAECAFCSTAVPMAEEVREGLPTFIQPPAAGMYVSFVENPFVLRTILSAVLASGLLLSLTACNTVQGVGEDVESVGRTAEDAIE